MKKNILVIAVGFVFIGCGSDSGTITIVDNNTSITVEQKRAKNPNFDLYNEDCQQGQNSQLCGFEPELSDNPSASMPNLPCEDEVYCL